MTMGASCFLAQIENSIAKEPKIQPTQLKHGGIMLCLGFVVFV
jgi:hypothetical protein